MLGQRKHIPFFFNDVVLRDRQEPAREVNGITALACYEALRQARRALQCLLVLRRELGSQCRILRV